VDAPDGDRAAPGAGVGQELLDVLGAQPLERHVTDGRNVTFSTCAR
jgi:hypothetical protein